MQFFIYSYQYSLLIIDFAFSWVSASLDYMYVFDDGDGKVTSLHPTVAGRYHRIGYEDVWKHFRYDIYILQDAEGHWVISDNSTAPDTDPLNGKLLFKAQITSQYPFSWDIPSNTPRFYLSYLEDPNTPDVYGNDDTDSRIGNHS